MEWTRSIRDFLFTFNLLPDGRASIHFRSTERDPGSIFFSIWLRSSTHRCLFTLYNFLFLILSIVIEFKFRILIGRETKRVKSILRKLLPDQIPSPLFSATRGKETGYC